MDALHAKYRNFSEAAARKEAYATIQEKVSESASTINPLIVLGRIIVLNPKVTGATFSQYSYARYVYLKPKS